MTPKQREKAVQRAVKAMDRAADALEDLQYICIDHGVDIATEEKFTRDLRERAQYWENCTWYKNSA